MPDFTNLPVYGIGIDASKAEQGSRRAEAAFQRVGRAADSTDRKIDRSDRTTRRAGEAYSFLNGKLLALTAGLSATAVAFDTFRTLRDYEAGLVGVGKTADLSGRALDSLGDRLINVSLDTGIAVEQLLATAQAAGQLGVKGSENILKFTETIAKLGTASNLQGDEAATTLARILNITGEDIGEVDRLATVIVALGNNAAATEAEIASMTAAVAQNTATFQIGSSNSAAFGTALAELNIRAQLGGSSLGRLYRALDETTRSLDSPQAALLGRLLGVDVGTLRASFDADPTATVRQFLAALGDFSRQGGSAPELLKEFGLQGEELLRVLPTLALNTDRVTKAFNLMEEELASGLALEEEFRRANDTLDGSLKRLGATYDALKLKARGSTGAIADGVDASNQAIRGFAGLRTATDALTEREHGLELAMTAVGLAMSVAVPVGAYKAVRAISALAGTSLLASTAVGTLSLTTATLAGSLVGLTALDFGGYLEGEFAAVARFGANTVAAFDTLGNEMQAAWETTILAMDIAWDLFLDGLVLGFAAQLDAVVFAMQTAVKSIPQEVFGALNVVSPGLGTALTIAGNSGLPAGTFTQTAANLTSADNRNILEELEDIDNRRAERQRITTGARNIRLNEIEAEYGKSGRRTGESWIEQFGQGVTGNREALISQLKELLGITTETAEQIANQMDDSLGADGPVATAAGEAEDAMTGLGDAAEEAMKKQAEAAAALEEAIAQLQAEVQLELSLIGKTDDERERAIKLAELQALAEERYGKASAEAARLVDDYRDSLERLDHAKQLQELGEQVGDELGRAFEDAIFNAKSFDDVLHDLFLSLSRLGFQEFFTGPVSDGLGALFSGFGGGGSSSSSGSNGMNGLYFGGNSSHRNFAQGGFGFFSQSTLLPFGSGQVRVGEDVNDAGEFLMPAQVDPRDGKLGVRAIPANGGSGGGTTVHFQQTVNIRSDDPFRASAKQGRRSLDRAMKGF